MLWLLVRQAGLNDSLGFSHTTFSGVSRGGSRREETSEDQFCGRRAALNHSGPTQYSNEVANERIFSLILTDTWQFMIISDIV